MGGDVKTVQESPSHQRKENHRVIRGEAEKQDADPEKA
jgi:hypothetical protein